MGGVHNSLSLTLFPISLLQSVNSNMGLYQRSSNSSQTSQYRFLPWNAVLHEETSPIEWFLSRKYEVWASPFMVAQVLPGSSFRTGSPQGHSLLWVYPWAYMEGQLPHHGFHHGLQGNLSSGFWSNSTPFFFTDLGSIGIFLSQVLIPLCHLLLGSSFSPS